MIGNRIQWCLPVRASLNKKESYWTHPKAKFHYFPRDEFTQSRSLCGKYFLDIDDFETYSNLKQGRVFQKDVTVKSVWED